MSDVVTQTLPSPLALPGRVVRTSWFSARLDTRAITVSTILVALIVAVGCWSISVGDFAIPIRDVVRTLVGTGSKDSEFIIGTLRLPRVLTGVLVGAAFAAAGAIFQSLTRNPLGSPDIIGFNSGAALGAVATIVVVGSTTSISVSAAAVAGGLATALIVYLCAWKRGVQTHRLVLVGIGIGYAVAALNDFLLTRAKITEVQRAAVWLTGSLNGRSWNHVRPVGIGLAVLLPAALLCCRSMRLLELGDDKAAALGIHVGRTKFLMVLIGVGLASLATASAGPIAFISLVSPPIARRLVRSAGTTLVPTALVGSLLTISADLVARRLLAPTELPVGIATAAIGAPYLLWLLTREMKSGAM